MAPLAVADISNDEACSYRESKDILYHELSKGINSVKNGDVYSIEEAWKEIDQI